ncbi:hypothetical protein ACF1E9_05195 [Streptomyces roseolus]
MALAAGLGSGSLTGLVVTLPVRDQELTGREPCAGEEVVRG